MGIKKSLTFAVALVALLGSSPHSANSSGFQKVTILVKTADGLPAQGQQISTSYLQNTFLTGPDGQVEFDLPSGSHSFSGNFVAPGSALNASTATTRFSSTVTQQTNIVLTLPKVTKGQIRLEDPSGQPISHAPLALSALGCPSTVELASVGLDKPPSLYVNPPRYLLRDSTGKVIPFTSPFISPGLRSIDGIATIDIFEIPLMNTSVSPPSFNGDIQNRCSDAGADGILDYGVKPASYQEWRLLDSSLLLAGAEKLVVPEAPQFQLKLPMRVLDVRDYQVRITATGTLSAAHPTVLEKHGKISAQILQGGGSVSRGTHSVSTSGDFSSELYINKGQTVTGASMALTTNLGFQSKSLPLPPRFQQFWRGQDLSLSVSGLNFEMGPTRLTYGKLTRSISHMSQGGEIKVTLRKATPVSKANFTNSIYNGTLQFTTAFAQCNQVWKVFDGGIAKSASSKNKGQKSQKVPTVFPEAYEQSKTLDRDKDGIVCER